MTGTARQLLDDAQRQQNIDTAAEDILRLLNDRFPGDAAILDAPVVLGKVLQSAFHDPKSLSESLISRSMDHAIAAQIGPNIECYLAVHRFLVDNGHTDEEPWDIGYLDRYAAAFADDKGFKSFAVHTQNFTYLVVITTEQGFAPELDEAGRPTRIPIHSVHLRLCCSQRSDEGYTLEDFANLGFLRDRHETFSRDYFCYQDGRDRGYLCSVTGHRFTDGWATRDTLERLSPLKSVTYDLASLVDTLRDA